MKLYKQGEPALKYASPSEKLSTLGAAGLERIRIHDLRHSHAALLVELGYSMPAIAERLGDTVEVVMETYVHLYPNKLTEMAADLDKQAVQNGVPGKDILSALLPPDGNKNG